MLGKLHTRIAKWSPHSLLGQKILNYGSYAGTPGAPYCFAGIVFLVMGKSSNKASLQARTTHTALFWSTPSRAWPVNQPTSKKAQWIPHASYVQIGLQRDAMQSFHSFASHSNITPATDCTDYLRMGQWKGCEWNRTAGTCAHWQMTIGAPRQSWRNRLDSTRCLRNVYFWF